MISTITTLMKIQGAAGKVAEIIYTPIKMEFKGTAKPIPFCNMVRGMVAN